MPYTCNSAEYTCSPPSLPAIIFLLQELQSSCAREIELEHSLTERTDATAQQLAKVVRKLEAEKERAAQMENELLHARESMGRVELRLREASGEAERLRSHQAEWEDQARQQGDQVTVEQTTAAALRENLLVSRYT